MPRAAVSATAHTPDLSPPADRGRVRWRPRPPPVGRGRSTGLRQRRTPSLAAPPTLPPCRPPCCLGECLCGPTHHRPSSVPTRPPHPPPAPRRPPPRRRPCRS